jgi:hypothetical protein
MLIYEECGKWVLSIEGTEYMSETIAGCIALYKRGWGQ